MNDLAQAAERAAENEYTIYTFDHPAPNGGKSCWEKRDTRTEMADALVAAENIFRTGKYGKVEVKQKFFDRKQNRKVDVTLKVFETGSKKEVDLLAMFLFALICAAAAFAATSLLNR